MVQGRFLFFANSYTFRKYLLIHIRVIDDSIKPSRIISHWLDIGKSYALFVVPNMVRYTMWNFIRPSYGRFILSFFFRWLGKYFHNILLVMETKTITITTTKANAKSSSMRSPINVKFIDIIHHHCHHQLWVTEYQHWSLPV